MRSSPARSRSPSTSSNGPIRGVKDRFEANCLKHGIAPERRRTIKGDAGAMAPADLLEAHAAARRLRFIHIDGEHSRAALDQGPRARHRLPRAMAA